MKIDEMKSSWDSAKKSINTENDGCPESNRRTALQRLGDQYRRFSRLSVVMALVGPLALRNGGISSPWIIAGYVILLLAAAATDHFLANSIRAIDLSAMPVAEVLERTLKCRKIHLLWLAVAMPFAIFWCAVMAYDVHADIYLFYGICAGAIVGLIVGLRVLFRFLRDYRDALHG